MHGHLSLHVHFVLGLLKCDRHVGQKVSFSRKRFETVEAETKRHDALSGNRTPPNCLEGSYPTTGPTVLIIKILKFWSKKYHIREVVRATKSLRKLPLEKIVR